MEDATLTREKWGGRVAIDSVPAKTPDVICPQCLHGKCTVLRKLHPSRKTLPLSYFIADDENAKPAYGLLVAYTNICVVEKICGWLESRGTVIGKESCVIAKPANRQA